MARGNSRIAKRPSTPETSPGAPFPTWGPWAVRFHAFQVHAVRDMLIVCTRQATALSASYDVQTFVTACQRAATDWAACIDSIQHEWLALSEVLPGEALAAMGWRLKPGTGRLEGTGVSGSTPDLFEQSRLGAELLLRPWLPAPDLDHTDEFVA